MKVSTSLLLYASLLIFISLTTLTVAQPTLSCTNCSYTDGNYTSNSIYSKNLKSLLGIMSSKPQVHNGFYNISVGQDPYNVYGIAVCRVDRSQSSCWDCLSNVAQSLPESCPIQKEATGWYYATCMLRYSDRPLFTIQENSPSCLVGESPLNVPRPVLTKFNRSRANLLGELIRSASTGNSSQKYSNGVEDVTGTLKVYGVTQCNPYLSTLECSICLEGVLGDLHQCCNTLVAAGIYGPICSVEFANYALLNANTNTSHQPIQTHAAPPSGDNGTKPGDGRGSAHKIWIIVVILVLLMLIVSLIYGLSRRKARKKYEQKEVNGQVKLEDSLHLDFSSIKFATDDFSDANRICKRSAIALYKGVLPDGQEIAVRKLHKQDRVDQLEFDNEVLLTASFQHKNLVKLLGFCIEKDVQIVVYEYLQNGSLHGFITDPVKRARLDWQTRYHIISGLARGLLYLHEDSQVRVIHRDLKPSNILLDVQMESKIANFRTASLIHHVHTGGDTRVVGTYGYMPAEYVQHGLSSVKSDIFSFGVILLEIITGQMISGFSDGEKEESFLTYVWRKWYDGNALDVVDPMLPNTENHIEQIKRCIKIGLLCVQEDPEHRPVMSTVVLMLNSVAGDITEPIRPGPLILNNMDLHSDGHSTQTDKSHESSVNEASISYLDPR